MKTVASWSGGKDSCLACYLALQQGHEIQYLVNFISKESKRGCFHGIAQELMQAQARCIGIPLVQKEVTADMKTYEEEFKTAMKGFLKEGIPAAVFGDIYLGEHKTWVERVCEEIGMQAVEPLWKKEPESLLNTFIDLGFKAVVVSAQAEKFEEDFVGRTLDKKILNELKAKKICPCGENGEFHTLVVDGPLFKQKIEITESRPVLKGGFWKHWFLDVKKFHIAKSV
jgi:diphthine-ammonia ligase